jgi:hypothetical protein
MGLRSLRERIPEMEIAADTQRPGAAALNSHGLLAHWNDVAAEAWVMPLLRWEEQERARSGLERRAYRPYRPLQADRRLRFDQAPTVQSGRGRR